MVPTPRHKTRFVATATPYTPAASEQMEVRASLDKLRALLPADIDPAAWPTLLFAAGNLAVADLANLNDDAITLEDTLRTYRAFQYQQVNEEHNRGEIRGFIVKVGLSELGTDRLITEEEARAANKPCNIAIVFALWRVVDSDLANWLQRADAPGSPDKGKLSLSFEVGFDDYDVVLLPKDASNLALATARITPDSPEFEHYSKMLRCHGGKGVYKDQRVARIIMGNIVPLGAGIVTVPAAAVKGLTTITESPHAADPAVTAVVDVNSEADAGLYKYSSTQCTFAEADAAPFRAFAASIPDEQVYTDEKDPTLGRVTDDFHATCLYGIKTADAEAIKTILAGFGPIKMTLGKVSMFEGGDRPYDVLKVDVDSPDLHRAHALIKTATETEVKWPTFVPHVTISYMKHGHARGYTGDTRFEGMTMTFSSITFSPHTGNPTNIPLVPQIAAAEVYSEDEAMATPSRLIKLPQGWQERLNSIANWSASPDGKVTAAGLPHGVTVTLSDGRKVVAQVVDTQTLEAAADLSMAGVVITDMTPGVGPQADDPEVLHPNKADIYPTKTPEKVAQEEAEEAKKRAAQHAGYSEAAVTLAALTDQSLDKAMETLAAALATFAPINTAAAGVSSDTTPSSPMNLSDLKQSLASVKTVEELPAVVANITSFADEIAKASEKIAAERKAAQDAQAAAEQTLAEIKAQLDSLTKTHNDMVASQHAAAAEAAFQTRMTSVNEVFAFDDEMRAEIVEDIKACADDAAFAKWMTKAQKTMKGWLKAAKCDDKHKEPDGDEKDEAKAKAAAKEALASAAANIVDKPIVNTLEVDTKTLRDRYAETFAKGIRIGGETVADITARATKKGAK